jgi:ThiF family protein
MPDASIVFCGAGFLGSWAIRYHVQRAAAMGLHYHSLVIDGDKFEERNRPTQNCYPRHIGAHKADVAVGFIEAFDEQASAINLRLGIADIGTVVEHFSPLLVVDTFDNVQSRLIAKFLADEAKCECLHLAISEQKFGRVEWSDKWSSDPTRCFEIPEDPKVDIEPCELPMFLELGTQVAMRGAVEIGNHLTGAATRSWFITDKEYGEQ